MKDLEKLFGGADKIFNMVSDLDKQLEALEETGESGAGLVKVTLLGTFEVRSVEIDPSLLKHPDQTLIQDLIAAAVNAAVQKMHRTRLQKGQEIGLQMKSKFGNKTIP